MSGETIQMSATPKSQSDLSSELEVVPRRYPWRWVAAAAVVVVIGWLVGALATAENMQWDVVWEHLFSPDILTGVWNTIVMTILCMVIGIVLGTLIAVMRLSPNPVLNTVASLYQWFFRGTPTLVQLIFWFNLSSIFPQLELDLFGLQLFAVDTNAVMTTLVAALLGLGLNFAAYYSEVVRAGILSVDEGQSDAAAAYGLSRFKTLRYIVLPQAMRVIIPPTGNELIGMLKWTSLASVVGYGELLRKAQDTYNVTYQIIPLLVVAALWYLAMSTVLSFGQIFVERHFARGSTRNPSKTVVERMIANARATRGKGVSLR